jgi:hypothetical protein
MATATTTQETSTMTDKVETFDDMSWERSDCGAIYRHGVCVVRATNGDAWSGRHDVYEVTDGNEVRIARNLRQQQTLDLVNEINKASA